MITKYHAKYYAHNLLRVSTEDGIEKISRSLFDACVDLNPHQIEAALFALKSPLSKGVVLADEVGLGKTIEAGIVLCQYWAERKRKLLVVCPASLRKQWSIELEEKFSIPSIILEAKTFNQLLNDGYENPFLQEKVIICSYQFINSRKEIVKLVKWDLAVIDEAHKLRNAYRPSNVLGRSIRCTLEDVKKLLLTATPLQNSLMELFGLSTIINEYMFGDRKSFRQLYINESDLDNLKTRLQGFCKRTLREQVLEYIPYTNRKAITIKFSQTDQEVHLYQEITSFLQKPQSYALPSSQKTLITLVIRKILASSSYALIKTLEKIKQRLEKIREGLEVEEDLINQLSEDENIDAEELEDMGIVLTEELKKSEHKDEEIDREILEQEIKDLEGFINEAKNIKVDSKTKRLREAIERGFVETSKMRANKKVVVFTESRRTQQYLKEFLDNNGYSGRLVTFNGTNTDKESKKIYKNWLKNNKNTGRISGSLSSDKRNAILEYFRNEAEILIATESAAEGINLQFCSLVMNYDLPWNPQRIEQRIGRCHRYGQKYDVVVINFLNERNEIDRKVYNLLKYKFKLFSGVFGASDEVLGALESGVDFEKEVLKIYQECRKPSEIQKVFEELQYRMDKEIQSRFKETKEILVEHFDEDVHSRLKMHLTETQHFLNKMEKHFWSVTEYVLQNNANFDWNNLSFYLKVPPCKKIKPGKYHLISKRKNNIDGKYLYRMSHPLGEYVLEEGKKIDTPYAELHFDISNNPSKISVVQDLKGKTGYMVLSKLTIKSFEKDEYLLFNAFDKNNNIVHHEVCAKMFECLAEEIPITIPKDIEKKLLKDAKCYIDGTIDKVMERNNVHYQEECECLFRWSEDLTLSAEKDLKDTKNRLKMLNRQMRQSSSMQEKYELQTKIKKLAGIQRKQRQKIFDVEDEIEEKRDELINKLTQKMKQKTELETLFIVKWKII
jgi:ERCC4-related helicase